jgi:polysaccharide pyruvyl transferase WcaK-like protein
MIQVQRASKAPRIGFFGILSGNFGNEGSLEAVVNYIRREHSNARLGFLCMGPEHVSARYGAPATALQWYEPHAGSATGVSAAVLKVLGKLLDPIRTLAWVRHCDIVIVPGMGVLEDTVPIRPWGIPYSLLWLGLTARITGTRVAMLSVGSNVVTGRLTRWLITRAARLAHYRSFRDDLSRQAMGKMGVDVGADKVYPDLAFALPAPPSGPHTNAVGVGVMAFYGSNGDRWRADELYRAYLETMKGFVCWLVDAGRQVCLFIGDKADEPVVLEILADIRLHRREADATRVVAVSASTVQELLHGMANVDTVVASRYHNVIYALKLGKPTVSIGYAAKHEVLMASVGLADFFSSAYTVDLDHLIDQFIAAEAHKEKFVAAMAEYIEDKMQLVDEQFKALSQMLSSTAQEKEVPSRV